MVYREIKQFEWKFFQVTQKDLFVTGLFGSLWSADIHVSTMLIKESPKPVIKTLIERIEL